MSFDLVELDLAARALRQSLDLASGGRERWGLSSDMAFAGQPRGRLPLHGDCPAIGTEKGQVALLEVGGFLAGDDVEEEPPVCVPQIPL
jgi:hypothetical protein